MCFSHDIAEIQSLAYWTWSSWDLHERRSQLTDEEDVNDNAEKLPKLPFDIASLVEIDTNLLKKWKVLFFM